MRKSFAFLFVLFLAGAPAAFALNPRSAVSINGNDLNPCTVASPCRSFTAALNATAVNGEVIALDSAGYGPFTVFFSVTVSGAPGVHAAITASAGNGIDVTTAGGDAVTIRNLVLIGAGGANGIDEANASNLRVLGCLIRGFTGFGIEAHAGNLSVDHSIVLDTNPAGPGGVAIGAFSNGTNAIEMTITNSLIERYGSSGIAASGLASAMVVNCTITRGGIGVAAESQLATGVAARVTIEASTITRNNTGIATISSGGNNTAIIYIAQDEISYNTTGATGIGGGSSFKSFSNNRFTENGTDGGPFASIALK